ncbi:unnamed protein product [Adineta steineri]|uniref:Uncharacterized protein n=2 Tax=Adineta steineri TaxID=433720 RepID=A0A815TQD2_9BILA|nr:unnamed protein product [Adineta steineri]
MEDLMIEQWNPSSSYEQYWEACAPIYCTYSQIAHTKTFIGVLMALVSIISSLTVVLRIGINLLAKFVIDLFKRTPKRQNEVKPKLYDRLKKMFLTTMMQASAGMINLNIFPIWRFGSNTDRMTAKRLGQWSTRLYIVLFLTSLTIIIIYIGVQPQMLTKSFNEPNLNVYNRLLREHGDTLQCPCSSISSTYSQFIQIKPVFHQVCSSIFVSNAWRTNLTNGLVSDLSIYDTQDYRRFLSAHLQFLKVKPKLYDRLKKMFLTTMMQASAGMMDLNIFPIWRFGSNTDRMTAKRLGQWSTRIYIILFTMSLTIIIIYIGVQPQMLTKSFNEPSLNVYNRLLRDHGDTLQCPCSLISSTYSQFIQIKPVFHQVRILFISTADPTNDQPE